MKTSARARKTPRRAGITNRRDQLNSRGGLLGKDRGQATRETRLINRTGEAREELLGIPTEENYVAPESCLSRMITDCRGIGQPRSDPLADIETRLPPVDADFPN